MTKSEFVARMIKDQAERKKRREREVSTYKAEASWRMQKRYRGNLLRSVHIN